MDEAAEEIRGLRARVHELSQSIHRLQLWQHTADLRIGTNTDRLDKFGPAIEAMMRADEIAEAIREHNHVMQDQAQERSTLRLTRWQVIGGLIVGGLVAADILSRMFS